MAKKKWGIFSARKMIDRYFLGEKNAYSKRRPVKTKVVVGVVIVASLLFVGSVIWLGGPPPDGREGKDRNGQSGTLDLKSPAVTSVSPLNNAVAVGQSSGGVRSDGRFSGISLGLGGRGGTASQQSHSANQVIRRGAGGNDPGAALPLATTLPVRLINAILSTDSTSPVIAELTEDVYAHGTLSIPATTRAIGTAQYDESSRRIQLRFQTLVYPEGDQHGIAAIGTMPDGSAGLEGDYHSGEVKRQGGRFLGYFVSGMADGMKDRKSGGEFGSPYEPGSIKNGALNGVSLSAQDQAKSYTDDLNQTKPTMTLPPGQSFVLFLEHEYIP